MANVGALVEVYTLVALTGTEEVTGYRVICNLSQRTRHTERTARHRDVSSSGDVRHLVTAIDARQNMTAADVHIRVTLYQAGRRQPLIDTLCCGLIGKVTRATTKDIAIERMTVRTCCAGCAISFCLIMTITSMLIVWLPRVPVCPCGTLIQCISFSTISYHGRCRIYEGSLCVSCCLVLTKTNLTTPDIHMGVIEHTAVLCTTIDTTCNQG